LSKPSFQRTLSFPSLCSLPLPPAIIHIAVAFMESSYTSFNNRL
jgi:hypothetical protein